MSGRALVGVLAALALGACWDLGDRPFEPAAAGGPHGGPAGDSPRAPPGGSQAPEGQAATPDGDPAGGDPADGATQACPHPDGAADEVLVVMENNAFEPAFVEVCVGDTVVWENRDSKEHTVYTGTPEAPDGLVGTAKLYYGDTYARTFDAPGDYVYYCSTHKKKMRDAVVAVR